MTKFATIAEALQALPVGVDNIAAHLAAMGIKGTCGDSMQCALAEYLTASIDVPEHHTVSVGRLAAGLHDLRRRDYRPAVVRVWFDFRYNAGESNLSRPDVSAFVGAFDEQKFPELIANPDGNSWYSAAGSAVAA